MSNDEGSDRSIITGVAGAGGPGLHGQNGGSGGGGSHRDEYRLRHFRGEEGAVQRTVRQFPGTKKDAGTAIWPSKLSPLGFRMVLYYVTPLAASSWSLGFRYAAAVLQVCCTRAAR